jgi:hypothetical protein
MGFYTKLEIVFGGDTPDMETVAEKILLQLDSDGIHHNVLQDVRQAFETGEAGFSVHAAYLVQLIESIAALLPECSFEARGLGEEFRHTWVRSFEDGKLTFEAGPWDYD